MTDTAGATTSGQPAGGNATKEDATALGFMAIMGLMFGGAAVLIAALAVGIERTWSGRSSGPGSGGWRQSAADHAAWLEQDRARRAAWSQARRDWWGGGADPAAKPVGPSWTYRAGLGLRRWWARLVVSADRTYRAGGRFGGGFRAGWVAANARRRGGASPWEVVRTRPQSEVPPEVTPAAEPVTAPAPTVEPDAPDVAAPGSNPDAPVPADNSEPDSQETDNAATQPVTPEGEQTMTAPTATASSNRTAAAPAGETHLDLTEGDLATIHGHLSRVQELNDQMAGVRAALEGAVAAATERATVNGATSATQQALDEANAVVALLGQHLANVSDATSQAEDHTSAAQVGLAPARDAQDALHQAGARGEFVSAATSD